MKGKRGGTVEQVEEGKDEPMRRKRTERTDGWEEKVRNEEKGSMTKGRTPRMEEKLERRMDGRKEQMVEKRWRERGRRDDKRSRKIGGATGSEIFRKIKRKWRHKENR